METTEVISSEIEQEMEFTSLYRWQHWVRAVSIVVLTITGFYLAMPFVSHVPNSEPTNFMYALFRSWHEIFGFVMIGVVLFKSYLFIFARKHKMEMESIKDFVNI